MVLEPLSDYPSWDLGLSYVLNLRKCVVDPTLPRGKTNLEYISEVKPHFIELVL